MNGEDQLENEEQVKPKFYVASNFFQDDVIRQGFLPIFLSAPTVEIFGLAVTEEEREASKSQIDITYETVPHYLVAKAAILDDLFKRAAVSDFAPLKQKINSYGGKEILLIKDDDYKYGENFVICLNEDAKSEILIERIEMQNEGSEEEPEEEFETNLDAIPTPIGSSRPAKTWINLGSDLEIDEASAKATRDKIAKNATKIGQYMQPINLAGHVIDKTKKNFHISIPESEEKPEFVTRMELDKSVTCINDTREIGVNTKWPFPTNQGIQYVCPVMGKDEIQESTSEMKLTQLLKMTEYAIDANLFYEPFVDDYKKLEPKSDLFGMNAKGSRKELAVFSNIKITQGRFVTCVREHPLEKTIFAISLGEKLTYDERIIQRDKLVTGETCIMFWSFYDPIYPQLLLYSREEVNSFAINPSQPAYVAGALMNGQIALWDASAYQEAFSRVELKMKEDQTEDHFRFQEFNSTDPPKLYWSALSNIDASHECPVMDIQWLPDHIELSKTGIVLENKDLVSHQLISAGLDGRIFIWDIRVDRCPLLADKNRENILLPACAPLTFEPLHEKMKPLIKVTPIRPDDSPILASRVSIHELQGDRSILKTLGDPTSDERDRPLTTASTMLYVGSEDGELAFLDWMPMKDQDTGRVTTPKPEFVNMCHMGPIVMLERCPYYPALALVVGGYSWSLWLESVSTPLLTSFIGRRKYSGGCWCARKPSCFFLIRVDGALEIWDLLKKTFEPVAVETLTSNPLTAIRIWEQGDRLVMVVADLHGLATLYKLPDVLFQSQLKAETEAFKKYVADEVQRHEFFVARYAIREVERIEIEAEAKRRAMVTVVTSENPEEAKARQKIEYEAFLTELQKFKTMLDLDNQPKNI
ncbi:WD repeat-containing protein 63 [Cichlidogyrus casuarinus]|uniref:WD repeat-containing protein 63 n=1 Tax=Cichlidogyrus casuarinus TaxID=1844966 RepID=A0ABD2QMV2_9PLAT